MNEMERIQHALGLLREADSTRRAPDHINTRLRAAFHAQHSLRRSRSGWFWVPAFAAAAVAIVAWRLSAPDTVVDAPAPPPPIAAARPPLASPAAGAAKQPLLATARRKLAPRRVPAVPAPVQEAEAFIALPYAPPLTTWDRGQIVRVGIPRQSLRSLGFPVNEERMSERVPADLLVGEDGLARGIRFVRTGR